MNILVCVKQVPGSNNVKVDEETGLLVRPKTGNKLNPYDLYALETALSLKERFGGTVKVITMGPPQARSALEECIWMGCDEGILLTDRAFGGADVLATSYTISQGIACCGDWDLILCGKQTTDGDTAQVGAETAEHLGIPHLSNVVSVIDADGCGVTVRANQEKVVVTERIQLPCLLCMESEVNTPRLPSYRRKKAMDAACIRSLGLSDLKDTDPGRYGLKGSPTKVRRVFPPEKSSGRTLVNGTADELSAAIAGLLAQRKFIGEGSWDS